MGVNKLNVLVACEESQRVCLAFREKGHNAFSCDILPCSGGFPQYHICSDVLPILNGNCTFITESGDVHTLVGKWDLIIAHPPCTRLCNTGQRWLHYGSPDYRLNKLYEQSLAVSFFMEFVNCDCDKVVIENPVGIMSRLYRKPDVIYNPYDFLDETECKKTCLWVRGVSPLIPTRSTPLPVSERTHGIYTSVFDGVCLGWSHPDTARLRSQTLPGVASAMAEQWG